MVKNALWDIESRERIEFTPLDGTNCSNFAMHLINKEMGFLYEIY